MSKNIIKDFNLKKILLIRNDRIGDIVISEPFIRYLKSAHSDIQIDILLSKKNINSFWIVSDFIDNCHCYQQNIIKDLLLLRKLKNEKYDLIIDLKDKESRTSKIIIDIVKAKYSVGFKYADKIKRYDFELEKLDPIKNHVSIRTSNLLKLFGFNTDDLILDYKINIKNTFSNVDEKISFENNKKLFIINLAGNNEARFWGEDNYVKFINLLNSVSKKYNLLLLYSKEYELIAKNINLKTHAKLNGLIKSTEEYAYTISKADIILTPDTSAVHIASAFKIKTIALYNFDFSTEIKDEMPWLPFNTDYKVFGSPTMNMKDIEPENVLKEIIDFI